MTRIERQTAEAVIDLLAAVGFLVGNGAAASGLPPGGSGIKASGGTVAYAWFVWEHGFTGPPTIGWI